MDAWEYELPPALAAVRPAAVRFRTWAAERATDAAAADCELALVEACNNLITHNAEIPGCITLRAEANAFEIILTIRDATPGFAWPKSPSLPEPDAEQGRGIFLIHTLMTEIHYTRHPGANQLRLRRLV